MEGFEVLGMRVEKRRPHSPIDHRCNGSIALNRHATQKTEVDNSALSGYQMYVYIYNIDREAEMQSVQVAVVARFLGED
jgi:hypothetical protein